MIPMTYFVPVMFLAETLNNIRDFEPNIDRQKKLAETLKNPEKLAKVEIRIKFLTACRKNDLIPRFIEDATRPVRHIFKGNEKVGTHTDHLAKNLLNEAIAESFRSKAFLVRQRTRLFENIRSFLSEDSYRYLSTTCARIFEITIRENRPRLLKKFWSLKNKIQDKLAEQIDMDLETVQKRVNNLSSMALDAAALYLLAKGPNFAATQIVSKSVMLQVEKSIERFSYAKRWKDIISKGHRDSPSCGTPETDPTPADNSEGASPEDVIPPTSQAQRPPTTASGRS